MAEVRGRLARRVRTWAVASVILAAAWWFSAYLTGAIAACVDWAHGHREVQVYGTPPPYAEEYAQTVRERYGVEIRAVPEGSGRYADGYNAVAWRRFMAPHKRDIFGECAEEARMAWLQTLRR